MKLRRHRNDAAVVATAIVESAIVFATEGYSLGPGDRVLHSCGGEPSAWLRANHWAYCTACSSPLGPDQPTRRPHAWLICGACHGEVGICLGFDPVAEAEALMRHDSLTRTAP